MQDRISAIEGVRDEIDPQAVADPTLAFLKAYWDRLRGERAMPARGDIRPVDMKAHLGWIVLLDVLPEVLAQPRDFRHRTVGTRLTEHFHTDPTGRTVSEFYGIFGAQIRDGMLAVLRRVVAGKTPVLSAGMGGMVGQPYIRFSMLYLPLSDDGESVNIILGGMKFEYAGT